MGSRGGVAENGVDDTCFAPEVPDSGLVRPRKEKWGISVEVDPRAGRAGVNRFGRKTLTRMHPRNAKR